MNQEKENYYHIYILLKDRILFESELIKEQISFHADENQVKSRYYLYEKDKAKVDKILLKNEIIANDETREIVDYRDTIKVQKFYFFVEIVIVLVVLIIDYFK